MKNDNFFFFEMTLNWMNYVEMNWNSTVLGRCWPVCAPSPWRLWLRDRHRRHRRRCPHYCAIVCCPYRRGSTRWACWPKLRPATNRVRRPFARLRCCRPLLSVFLFITNNHLILLLVFFSLSLTNQLKIIIIIIVYSFDILINKIK